MQIHNVSKSFGHYKALHQVSFSVKAAKPCIIVGPNGAGKSTLLKIIAGLLSPDEGSVTFDDSIKDKPIGYISHEPGLYSSMTVLENISLFRELLREKRTIKEVLDEWNIASLSTRTISELSKGQQARVGLARVCMAAPSLLVLDEPTAFLDADAVKLFIDKIQAIKDGATILIASHDIDRLKNLDATVFNLEAQ